MGNGIVKAFKPEVTPGPYQEPSFDVMYGFPEGRKERGLLFSYTLCHHQMNFYGFLVMIATEEQMMSAKLPLKSSSVVKKYGHGHTNALLRNMNILIVNTKSKSKSIL